MKKLSRKMHAARLLTVCFLIFILLSCAVLHFSSRYITEQMLLSNKSSATDIALLVKNNFAITDAEVAYMKQLTFNEMEVDPINARLMAVGDGVQLKCDISNVYIVAPLTPEEAPIMTDEEAAAFLGYDLGTVMDGMWLLNGTIDEQGCFAARFRPDIYRYTVLDEYQRMGMETREPFGEMSSDAWGEFITGYAPIFTVEGSFVGLLGIDMNPDQFQTGARNMINTVLMGFGMTVLLIAMLFLIFYYRYTRVKENQLEFDFYSRMSHDMRTPMNGILGMAELSRDENDVAALHRSFEQVEASGRYMLGLINDTLDVQRIESGHLTLKPKPESCRRVVEELTCMIQPTAQQKEITFLVENNGVELEHWAMMDMMRIKQVFMNLVSNAVKFTPEGGSVRFVMTSLGQTGDVDHCRFQVIDTGIGMSPAFVKNKLFKPFEQENNTVTSQYAGSGLGLTIVKRLVELMGGTIGVESVQGKGTTFTVELSFPLTAPPETSAASAPSATASENLQGRRILLCEDHPVNAEIARRMLEKVGCIVTTAENGQKGVEAFAASEAGSFDAVLMDVRMPVMDGLTAARTLRALPRADAATVPIIAMTANAYEEDRRNSREAGMNAHLSKPVDSTLLYQTLAEQIGRTKTQAIGKM